MSLLGALKIIPWNDVVAAAPAVVRGAQQLWNKVRHETADDDAGARAQAAGAGAASAADPLAAIEARMQALESRLAQQARETAAASELIAALAEQNARLIETVERLRRRLWVLAVAAALLGVGVAASIVLALTGR